jgi:hypothetical protein
MSSSLLKEKRIINSLRKRNTIRKWRIPTASWDCSIINVRINVKDDIVIVTGKYIFSFVLSFLYTEKNNNNDINGK